MAQPRARRRQTTPACFVFAATFAALLIGGCAGSNGIPSHRGRAGDDLAGLQGSWEQLPDDARADSAKKRVVKRIANDSETVTSYDQGGGVVNAQTARFQLGRSGDVPTYTFFDRKITTGPEAGRTIARRDAFIYRLRGDDLWEVWGLLPGQEKREVTVVRWKRVKE